MSQASSARFGSGSPAASRKLAMPVSVAVARRGRTRIW